MRKFLSTTVVLAALLPMTGMSTEWRFRSAVVGDQSIIFLSEETSTNRACDGKRKATEQSYTLERWVFVRDLCWEIEKPGTLKFTDPDKVRFFNTFTRPASGFVKIPSKKELAEIAEQQRLSEMTRASNEMIRQHEEEQRLRRSTRRAPIICNHLGDMSICD